MRSVVTISSRQFVLMAPTASFCHEAASRRMGRPWRMRAGSVSTDRTSPRREDGGQGWLEGEQARLRNLRRSAEQDRLLGCLVQPILPVGITGASEGCPTTVERSSTQS
jgi:hypothetical protein